jgi:hypothetical protein
MTFGDDEEGVDSQTDGQMPASVYQRAVTWRRQQLSQEQRCFTEKNALSRERNANK